MIPMTTSTGEDRGLDPAAQDRQAIPVDTFAARVMLARAYVGLNIEDAAQKCGLNRQSWSNWEKGMRPRDFLDVVQAISEGLGIDRDWLMWGGPLAPEKRRPRLRRRDSLSYFLAARGDSDPINRGTPTTGQGRPPTFGQRSAGRKIDNRPPGHSTSTLRGAA